MNPSDRLLISRARNYGKWWLHIHEQQKGAVQEDVDGPEKECNKSKTKVDDQQVVYREKQLIEEFYTKAKPCSYGLVSIDRQCKVIENYVHLEQNSTKEELNMIIGDDLQKPPDNKHKICSKDPYDVKDLDSYTSQESQSSGKECSELDYYLKRVENSEPWLYTSDRGELSSFITYRPQAYPENHDILGCRIFGRSSTVCSHNYDKVKDKTESYMSTETQSTLGNLASAIVDEDTTASPPIASTNSSAKVNRNDGSNATDQAIPGTEVQIDHNVNRLHLLEALCHSQTRAREAEKFAQQNCDEKEQIIKLYFRQASQLFAYKQWVEILRLENVILQLRNSGVYISTNFPVRTKGRQTRKGKRWTEKKNNGKPKTETGNSFIAFAIGLGLAGAGLLLGWTIGWLFSTF